jgi:hypothetical protein
VCPWPVHALSCHMKGGMVDRGARVRAVRVHGFDRGVVTELLTEQAAAVHGRPTSLQLCASRPRREGVLLSLLLGCWRVACA